GIFQIGANAGQTVGVEISRLTADRLGASDQVGVSAFGTGEALANGDLTINGIGIGSSRAGDDTASTANAAASAIAKVEAINRHSDETGVTAFANENVVSGNEMKGAQLNGTVTINGVDIEVSTSNDTGTTRASITEAINAVADQTGVRAVNSQSDTAGVQLVAEDGRNVEISYGDFDISGGGTLDPTVADELTAITQATGLASSNQDDGTLDGVYEGGYTLIADGDVSEIVISGGNGTGRGDLSNAGLTAGTYDRAVASSVSEAVTGNQAAATIGGGTFANTVNAALTNITTNETAVSVTVGDEITESVLATGSTVAVLADQVNSVEGVNAWEEISLELTGNSLAAGDTLTLTAGGENYTISQSVTGDQAALAEAINNGTYDTDGNTFDVSAEYNADTDNIALTIRNYTTDEVAFATTANDVTSGAGTLNGNVATGELAFSTSGNQEVSVSLADPVTGGELFANNAASETYAPISGLSDGDLVINDVNIGAARTATDTASALYASDGNRILSSSKALSAIAVAESINRASEETGVIANVNATEVIGGDGENADPAQFEEGDQAGLYINGVNVGTVTLQADSDGAIDTDRARADTLNLINQSSAKTGVVAVDNGISLTLNAADGRNVSIAIDDQSGQEASVGALFGLDSAVEGIGESTFSEGVGNNDVSSESLAYETTYGTLTLESAGQFSVAGGSNGTDALEALGLRIGTFGGGEDGQFLKDIDVSTYEGAQAAITAVDNALSSVSNVRSDLGAIQNRFESTIGNLEITRENLTAANSRIRDADFAAESAELSRTQVLQQAGISILAQANQRPQQALSLLG
ncbi:MAG: flagellin, partial [Natronospirillum sp.]